MSRIRPDRLPGASYPSSNALIVAQRKVLRLQEPFNITFDGGKDSQPLTDWYNNHSNNPYIQTLQLRKERDGPFYHEFVVFRLRAGTYWRIDRRQLPDEEMPLDSIFRDGVTARDTMEQVTSFDASLYSRSDCLIELEFKVPVHVGLILRVCRSIQNHAKLYTLQRYNCYFFAQTLTLCTACGVSDWAGMGKENEGRSPWRSPNSPFTDFYKKSDLENNARLQTCTVNWSLDDSFNFAYDWGQLSRLSNILIHSDSNRRQRGMSGEVGRLKHEIEEYWSSAFRQVLNRAYLESHKRVIASGIWRLLSPNVTNEEYEQVMQNRIDEVKIKWEQYSKDKVENLIAAVKSLLDPTEVCDAWYSDPDEWKSIWACKDGGIYLIVHNSLIIVRYTLGGPVRAAFVEWEKQTRIYIESETSQLKRALEVQTIQAGEKVQEMALRARINSFTQSMNIKIRVAHEGEPIIPGGAAPSDQRSAMSGKTKLSTSTTKTRLTMRAAKFKSKMDRFFSKSHKMEEANIMQMKSQIEELIGLHAARVDQYRVLLNCGAREVQTDIKDGVDQIWNYIIG
ncbi:hypothetical protein RHS04_06167 [Rhizoctonia solani]|uniref:Uncharacterized protein n=1 Tax=Rhizoctonia solani TaxID=456999 RepID=A0A8H7LHW5_9AGAM|nr:hypothetical protein RHS04_06167 [Rhizoctonia solani]